MQRESRERQAFQIHVQGIVQGVGFRPFVYRLAHQRQLAGWVLNAETGVRIHLEGASDHIQSFLSSLTREAPPAAVIRSIEITETELEDLIGFEIYSSLRESAPTVWISPDLGVCHRCIEEMQDPSDRRHGYPYVNCTHCGPRYSIITSLPYDRSSTTMREWAMCPACASEYHDPLDRRFHAQPTACPVCGPQYYLQREHQNPVCGEQALREAVRLLKEGSILAIKGLGGYHLSCDAGNRQAIQSLRERKFRKERPFALMAPDLETAAHYVHISESETEVLTSLARPIVLLPVRTDTGASTLPEEVAPGNLDLGIMLPYTPLHHLLFEYGAPQVLVLTSANRSSEPIAYLDDEAFERLSGIADAFLVGERPIARRVDDSVVRVGPEGPIILRRARGFAPAVVSHFLTSHPILAVGADLKNTLTLVINGEAFVSQYLGDLEYYDVEVSFRQTLNDLVQLYDVSLEKLVVAHDLHPQYRTTLLAEELPGPKRPVQHHRAHIASVLAERQAWEKVVVGFSFDGTGYGDDGSIWGGEVFVGSTLAGLERVAHLFPVKLPGGDAAARFPVQAAAGFLALLSDIPEFLKSPFHFSSRFDMALQMVRKNVRTHTSTSMGRLFDTVAALVGFTREITFEGQAAIWLEHLARTAPATRPYSFTNLDFRPLLTQVIQDRLQGRPPAEIARAFHAAVADEIVRLAQLFGRQVNTDTLVVSGGVFQNSLLLDDIHARLQELQRPMMLWCNQQVPPNDGGISLGQAALALHG